jgi:UDP-N-acetylmuramoyl-L-alanyl-D-glutamate--2,6-diaminopimelate ligase
MASEPARGVSLGELVAALARAGAVLHGDAGARVTDVRHDSRKISRGELFVARRGARTSGVEHAAAAVAGGASAILVARGSALPAVPVPIVEVDDVRLALALAAEALHGNPSRGLDVIGITGTNGKTTTSFLVEHALSGAGARPGRLGTLGFHFGDEHVDSPLTTPEADEIARYAARVRDAGGSHLVMEVSSHALAQARVDATRFAVAAFTNLTQDHLDYHGTLDEYARAKRRLFTELRPRASAINVDDPFGAGLARDAALAEPEARLLRVSRAGRAEVRPGRIELDPQGLRGSIELPSGRVEIATRLVGAHNLDNVLLALAIVDALGLDAGRAAAALGDAPPVPGRLERCDEPGDDLTVLVDYAHTPDALSRALEAARALAPSEVVCVFGCGGDRDPDKRPKMGDAVGAGADRAFLTSDNPRSEDPAVIARAVEAGLRAHGKPHVVELDRSRAIRAAVLGARPGAVVLVAGKGHEPYQIVGGVTRPFDDRVEARRALAERRGGER